MKSAIITFHAPTNNGAFLQAYALQTYLEKTLHVDTEILDYQTSQQKELCKPFLPLTSISNILKNIFTLLHYKKLNLRQAEFCQMKKEYLHLTSPIPTENVVFSIYSDYDLLISGSDQIWNCTLHGFRYGGQAPYFLQNCHRKKISYATSLGPNDSTALRDGILPFFESISSYSALSVRENFAKELLTKYVKKTISTVLDPVFLLDKKDFLPLFKSGHTPKPEYILLYTINYNTAFLKKASEISKKLNLPVFVPYTGHRALFCSFYGFKNLYSVGPGCFLDLLDKAAIVLTDSFHGTAFSILFEKNFYCFLTKKIDAPDSDHRLVDLLKLSGQTERTLAENTDVLHFEPSAYTKNSFFDKKIKESQDWLYDAIFTSEERATSYY